MKQSEIEKAWRGGAECESCGIRDLVLFADLKAEDFSLIHSPIEEMTLKAGDALYNMGDEGDAVYTIRSGLVKLEQYLPDGGHRIVRLVRRGDATGLEAILDEDYAHTARVLRETLVCKIPKAVVTKLDQETPRLQKQLMKRWRDSVSQADDWLTSLSTGSAKARIARLILHLQEEGPKGEEGDWCLLVSREDMGAMLGVTTETASRVVAEFRRSGVLGQTVFGLTAFDEKALRDLTGEL